MDYSIIEGFSEKEIMDMYSEVVEIAARGGIWKLYCDDGTTRYTHWFQDVGNVWLNRCHYCYAYSCGNYSTLNPCNGKGGTECLIEHTYYPSHSAFIRT